MVKGILFNKVKDYLKSLIQLFRLEFNLLLQDLWTQIQPVFTPIIMIVIGLILLFVSLIFLGMTIAAFFYYLTQSFWLASFISMLFFFSLALIIILLSVRKLKNLKINLERSKTNFGL